MLNLMDLQKKKYILFVKTKLMKKKVKEDIKRAMRVEFAQLWVKSAVHKNKKKYSRKPKHKTHETLDRTS